MWFTWPPRQRSVNWPCVPLCDGAVLDVRQQVELEGLVLPALLGLVAADGGHLEGEPPADRLAHAPPQPLQVLLRERARQPEVVVEAGGRGWTDAELGLRHQLDHRLGEHVRRRSGACARAGPPAGGRQGRRGIRSVLAWLGLPRTFSRLSGTARGPWSHPDSPRELVRGLFVASNGANRARLSARDSGAGSRVVFAAGRRASSPGAALWGVAATRPGRRRSCLRLFAFEYSQRGGRVEGRSARLRRWNRRRETRVGPVQPRSPATSAASDGF